MVTPRCPRPAIGAPPRATLALAGVIVIVGLGGCGSDASDQARATQMALPPTPSAARQREARAAARQQRLHGALLAGSVDPEAVITGVECEARVSGADLIDCSSGQGVGGEDPLDLTVRLESDGTLSKVLGVKAPVAGPKSSAQTAALLAADDHAQGAPSRSRPYACHPSPRLLPNGTPAGSRATGQLCTTYFRVSKVDVRRYVEFAPDGTVTRDYVLHGAAATS